MATVSGLEVDFETNLIDPLYMNAAIYEMNKKTEEGFYELSKHISDLYTFIFIVGELLTTYQPQELITLIKTTAPKMDSWPALPQILPVFENVGEAGRKATKRGRDVPDNELIVQMRRSLMPKAASTQDIEHVPAPLNEQNYDLTDLENKLKHSARVLETVENFLLHNIFNFGCWLLIARQQFQDAKSKGVLVYCSNDFTDWVEQYCSVKKTRAYDYMKFTERFATFPRVLKCCLPFHWFHKHGQRIYNYLQANADEGSFWSNS